MFLGKIMKLPNSLNIRKPICKAKCEPAQLYKAYFLPIRGFISMYTNCHKVYESCAKILNQSFSTFAAKNIRNQIYITHFTLSTIELQRNRAFCSLKKTT